MALRDSSLSPPEAFLAIVRRYGLAEQLEGFLADFGRYLAPDAAQPVPLEHRRETLFNLLAKHFDANQIAAMWRDWEAQRASQPGPAIPVSSPHPMAIAALSSASLLGMLLALKRR